MIYQTINNIPNQLQFIIQRGRLGISFIPILFAVLPANRMIYHRQQFLRLIIFHFRINIHSHLTVFMTRQILYRFGIYRSINQIGDIGMAKLMRCYLEIHGINQLWIIVLACAWDQLDGMFNFLSVLILIKRVYIPVGGAWSQKDTSGIFRTRRSGVSRKDAMMVRIGEDGQAGKMS